MSPFSSSLARCGPIARWPTSPIIDRARARPRFHGHPDKYEKNHMAIQVGHRTIKHGQSGTCCRRDAGRPHVRRPIRLANGGLHAFAFRLGARAGHRLPGRDDGHRQLGAVWPPRSDALPHSAPDRRVAGSEACASICPVALAGSNSLRIGRSESRPTGRDDHRQPRRPPPVARDLRPFPNAVAPDSERALRS